MTASPLSEASPNSISELMSRDPLLLTDEDVDKITAILREQRANWAVTEQAKQVEGKKARKKAATTEDISSLMKDLGL